MAQFLKYTLASIIGFFISLLILFFVLFGIISSVLSYAEKDFVNVKSSSVLYIKFDQPIPERTSNNPFETTSLLSLKPSITLGLNDILKSLDKASKDDKIKGIYLELSYIPAGIATLEEIREAILKFKESGKFVICYSELLTQGAYYIASAADEIHLNPEGMMLFKGLNAQVAYLKGLLDKLSIDVQIVKHGKYKSAVEPFVDKNMSEANREQLQVYLDNVWGHLLADISKSRNISIDELNKLADNLSVTDASKALAYNIIDKLSYKDEVLSLIKEKLNLSSNAKINAVSIEKYNDSQPLSTVKTRNKVAVIYASGSIMRGEGDDSSIIGSERISKTIREARNNDYIKAIVFRVNSGGGDVVGSEVIWREIYLTSKVKPVIASFGDYAASGAYWFSTHATRIIADNTCLTGSIGVFGMFPNLRALMNDKLGINFETVKTNKNADFINVYRPFTETEKIILQKNVDDTYENFINRVADGRNLAKAKVDEIGQGRIWSGQQGLELGLVDEIGGLIRAIEVAAELAEIEEYKIYELPVQKDPLQEFLEQIQGGATASVLQNELGEYYKIVEYLQFVAKTKGVQARLPFEMIVE